MTEGDALLRIREKAFIVRAAMAHLAHHAAQRGLCRIEIQVALPACDRAHVNSPWPNAGHS
jgi:hypothetical protein